MAMGLDRDDTIVRRRLRQKLEFLTEKAVETAPPSDVALQTFLQQHPDAFRVEPRLAFQHVYLSRDRRGDAANAEARRLLAQLSTTDATTDPAALGDAFLLPHDFALSSRSETARLFGDAFATQLQHLEPGRWVGPIESGYGLHLVFVRERTAGRVPALAEVRQASAGILGLLGIMAALFVFVTLVTAFVVALQRPWTRVVVRVAGSWIAAIGLLMLGWSLRVGN
jgi:hypothetical protein